MKRPLTLEQAKAQFVHRFTLEHVPTWTQSPMPNGRYPAPHFRSDAEWYANTKFHGEDPIATRKHCYTSNETWPLGREPLEAPYSR